MEKIAYLGAGTWGCCLTHILCQKGFQVTLFSRDPDLAAVLIKTREHPYLPGHKLPSSVEITNSIEEALQDASYIVESVTAAGVRAVSQAIAKFYSNPLPFILTSKGIEKDSALFLPEVALEQLGSKWQSYIGCISGPSHAEELINKIPTCVAATFYDENLFPIIEKLFALPYFHLYPEKDWRGVCFGGSMKNIIAILCGIIDGLGLGINTKAVMMTYGLKELSLLAPSKKALAETLQGIAGLGDLLVTCNSSLSRNYRFGYKLAQGASASQAQKDIGMVVEGAYTCQTAYNLAQKSGFSVPLIYAVYAIICQNAPVRETIDKLFQELS